MESSGSGSSGDEDETIASSVVDTVTSEVNPFLLLDPHVQPLHNPSDVVAKVQFSLPNYLNHQRFHQIPEENRLPTAVTEEPLRLDADGDLDVPRSSRKQCQDPSWSTDEKPMIILIEHMNSTTLDLVAHQIWRGAFVLSDFILANAAKYFEGKTILELGSGTGFSSIVASLVASKVIITDLDDENVLGLIKANLKHNGGWIKSEVVVKPLDFLNPSWPTELEDLVAEADIIIAADVVYHDKITDGFVRTLQKCLNSGKQKDVFISLEKRFVFTLSDLDVVAPAYDHFLEQMELMNLLGRKEYSNEPCERSGLDSSVRPSSTSANPVDLHDFPIYFNYEPSKDLVLWHLHNNPIQMQGN